MWVRVLPGRLDEKRHGSRITTFPENGVNPWSETNFKVHTLRERIWSSRLAVPKKQAHCDCTRTVHERVVFSLLGLAFERKQIPRFVGNVSS